jgi:hypothetical protein
MGKKVFFILGLHNHQPVGNFDHVLEEAYSKAYRPFLEVLSGFPEIPFVLHNSGVLWSWLSGRHPEYIELVGSMVERGQVELMSGGYYEPILSVIPERDRQGQLGMMKRFVEGRFGRSPRGCWLTERIWEPHMPVTLSAAGLEYVVVDDAHFKSTGFSSEEMRGFFLTEEDGAYVTIFPIDKRMRYLVPFRPPGETIDYLRAIADEPGDADKIVVLADDGEKFGLWPGTNVLCYEKKWLERMCELLVENGDWLELTTFSEAIDGHRPNGIVYLPTASYSEMMEWALPIKAGVRYRDAVDVLFASGRFQEPADMIRGGFWRNFLVKYEESNWMHKRMIAVSKAVDELVRRDENPQGAVDHLYQAQCNCAYWHGLFGGLYLPHLRSAVFSHLIQAENEVALSAFGDGPYLDHDTRDIDGDGVDELIVSTGHLRAFFKMRGGSLRELDLCSPPFNLTDTLTRREEIYHRGLAGLGNVSGGERVETVSIHERAAAKEKGLERFLVYDRRERESFLDHFIGPEVTLDSFAADSYRELGDFIRGMYRLEARRTKGHPRFVLRREGVVEGSNGGIEVALTKNIEISRAGRNVRVDYTIEPRNGMLRCRFASESVFSLLAGNAPDRYYRFPGRDVAEPRLASSGEERGVKGFSLVDEWLHIEIHLDFSPGATVWRFPIETVSNSETGFERIYQGSAVAALWSIDLEQGEAAKCSVRLSIDTLND